MDVTLFHLKPMQFLDVHMIFKMVSAVRDAIWLSTSHFMLIARAVLRLARLQQDLVGETIRFLKERIDLR